MATKPNKDGFGFRRSFPITEGGKVHLSVIQRLNIARRLYRVTGEGIYRDSVLTGDGVPIRDRCSQVESSGRTAF